MKRTIQLTMRRGSVFPLLGVLVLMVSGCVRDKGYPSRPITIVCPWAAGGGTDRVARQLAIFLDRELGTPVSVVNAIGGKGVTGHNRGLRARPDGYTLTMITFELNTMHWMGLTKLTYQDCIPLFSVNEDYAALLLRKDAPWNTLAELEAEIRARPRTLTASGTAVGGAWHLALAGWLNAAGFSAADVVWVPSAGANPSLQQLISGGVNMVCCSLPEARTLLEAGEVRALGVMAPQRAKGFEQVPTFPEQGRDWVLGGWRGLAVPRQTPPEVVDRLREAIAHVVSDESGEKTFASFMEKQKFDNTWRRPEEFKQLLHDTDEKLGKLLSNEGMRSVSHDRFDPMGFPALIAICGGIALLGIGVEEVRQRTKGALKPGDERPFPRSKGIGNFVLILAAVVIYTVAADSVGFIPLVAVLVYVMLVALGSGAVKSLAIAVLFAPSVYFLFAFALGVPLPSGWLG